MSSRTAYKGSRRRLVLAFDIGTTYSGISYRCVQIFVLTAVSRDTYTQVFPSILDPGQVPQIKGVTRFVQDSCDLERTWLTR